MFKDIRLQHSLTREQLAEQVNRSVNYILKAEQLTPTSAPTALLEFWSQHGYDKNILAQEYRHQQKQTRHRWLEHWEPAPSLAMRIHAPFRRMWVHTITNTALSWSENTALGGETGSYEWPEINVMDMTYNEEIPQFIDPHQPTHPTQYALSVGLCLPPASIHKNEVEPHHVPSVFRVAVGDLLEFVETGQFTSTAPDADAFGLHDALVEMLFLLDGEKHD